MKRIIILAAIVLSWMAVPETSAQDRLKPTSDISDSEKHWEQFDFSDIRLSDTDLCFICIVPLGDWSVWFIKGKHIVYKKKRSAFFESIFTHGGQELKLREIPVKKVRLDKDSKSALVALFRSAILSSKPSVDRRKILDGGICEFIDNTGGTTIAGYTYCPESKSNAHELESICWNIARLVKFADKRKLSLSEEMLDRIEILTQKFGALE